MSIFCKKIVNLEDLRYVKELYIPIWYIVGENHRIDLEMSVIGSMILLMPNRAAMFARSIGRKKIEVWKKRMLKKVQRNTFSREKEVLFEVVFYWSERQS